MPGRLEGQVIVVTGGASGIGEAMCRGMAREGADVVIADLNTALCESVASSIQADAGSASAVSTDVTDRASVRDAVAHAVEAHGRLDAFFNNAGVNSPLKFLDVTEQNWEFIMKVNALGVLIGMQEAAHQFIRQGGGGKIVNTASIASRTGFPDFAPYSASKAAVLSLIQAGARALATHKITVNGFAPGVVATPLWTQLDRDLESIGEGDAGFDSLSDQILQGRPAQPEDIVPTAIFLAAADSDYMTGQVIAIDGGMILV